MSITNEYGQFTDIPVHKQWVCNFDVLFIDRDHRRILNRQPDVRFYSFSNGQTLAVILIDLKAISN